MIALSTRHVHWLLLLLAAALLPIGMDAVRPRRGDDCRNPDLVLLTLAIPGSRPASSAAKRPARQSELAQWTQGQIENPEDPDHPLDFWIIRSFDPAAASPRSVLQGAFDPESHELLEVPSEAGTLPVRVAIDRTRRPGRLIAWTWVYEGRPVASLFPALLRAAPRRLLTGPVPVTIFLVDGAATRASAESTEAIATRWLADAWAHMDRSCR